MEDIHGSGNTASNINSNEVGIIQFPPLSSDSEGGVTSTASSGNEEEEEEEEQCLRQCSDGSSSTTEGSKQSSSSDLDEMEIEEIDFGNNPTNHQIKIALDKLIVAAKAQKKKQLLPNSNSGARANTKGDTASLLGDSSKSLPAKISLKAMPVQVIMTWMDSAQDNEKIQLQILQALPTILEDPPNRLAAQSNGLASIVLYNMAAFPNNALLQLTAFHTLVVLLRPLGANEGMVNKAHVHSNNKNINHHKQQHGKKKSSMNRQRALLDAAYEPQWEENGVRVMLDSLRRFASDRYLQAMGCWAMVNAALYPSLKTSILRLGGVYTVTNAMMLHPNVEAVQFRGLFALINLVIPDKKKKDGDGSSIHSHIYQIARLTIVSMKNFHANKSILNRGCLVLRNLSLTPSFVKILAKTPGCVDMLLHCRQVCPKDALLQRSARTIMILVQRAEKEGSSFESKYNSFKLTQPRPAPSTQASSSSSSGTTLSATATEQESSTNSV